MHRIDEYTEIIGIDIGCNAVTEIEYVPRPAADLRQQLARARAHDLAVGHQQYRVHLALRGLTGTVKISKIQRVESGAGQPLEEFP